LRFYKRIQFKFSLELEDALPNDVKSLFGSTDSFLLPKEEVFVEKSLYTDASGKLEPDCNPPKLEPNINMDGGMFFFYIFLYNWVPG
jgi:hypothetical protein